MFADARDMPDRRLLAWCRKTQKVLTWEEDLKRFELIWDRINSKRKVHDLQAPLNNESMELKLLTSRRR